MGIPAWVLPSEIEVGDVLRGSNDNFLVLAVRDCTVKYARGINREGRSIYCLRLGENVKVLFSWSNAKRYNFELVRGSDAP